MGWRISAGGNVCNVREAWLRQVQALPIGPWSISPEKCLCRLHASLPGLLLRDHWPCLQPCQPFHDVFFWAVFPSFFFIKWNNGETLFLATTKCHLLPKMCLLDIYNAENPTRSIVHWKPAHRWDRPGLEPQCLILSIIWSIHLSSNYSIINPISQSAIQPSTSSTEDFKMAVTQMLSFFICKGRW